MCLKMCEAEELCVCVYAIVATESNSALVNCTWNRVDEKLKVEFSSHVCEGENVFRELFFVILFYEAFLKSFYSRCYSLHASKEVCLCVCVYIIVHFIWFMEYYAPQRHPSLLMLNSLSKNFPYMTFYRNRHALYRTQHRVHTPARSTS